MVIQSIPTLIVTRPEPGGSAFVARLGRPAILSPVMAPEMRDVSLPVADALILTSPMAVEALRRLGADLPGRAFCVGDATAAAARDLGLQADSAAGDAEALLALILRARPQGRLLHVCGAETRGDLVARLQAAGFAAMAQVVYAQHPHPLTAQAVAALRGGAPVLLPVFSPRTAQILAAELDRIAATAPLWIVAISDAAAAPLRDLATRLEVAARPDAEAMAAAVARFFATAARNGAPWVEPGGGNVYRGLE